MRPPFPYFGGKQMLAERIVSTFPAHQHYVEPFAGSLAVLLAKPPSKMETVNDLDHHITDFWRVLRDRPEDLERVCALTPHSRVEKDLAQREPDCDDELERARRTWVQLTQGRSGTRRNRGWRFFEKPSVSVSMPDYLDGYVARIAPAAARLKMVSLECRPAVDMIEAYGAHDDALIYADPPYLSTVRGRGNNYAHEYRTDDEHRELADALQAARAAVVLSGYDSPLYAELFDGWRKIEISAFTGNGVEGSRTEVLWFNRPAEDVLDFGGAA